MEILIKPIKEKAAISTRLLLVTPLKDGTQFKHGYRVGVKLNLFFLATYFQELGSGQGSIFRTFYTFLPTNAIGTMTRARVRSCCVTKGVAFCFECSDFPCANWDEMGKFSNVFNSSKKKRLQEMKEVGVEQWVKNQWK
jgi:hypothetical protein